MINTSMRLDEIHKLPDIIDTGFSPGFIRVNSVSECADLINRPHEDYPKRVQRTDELINYYANSQTKQLMEFDILQMHSFVMWDLPSKGRYRSIDVTVGKHAPPHPMLIKDYVRQYNLFPVNSASDISLINWYKKFQSIHPFEDGNGRIGGMVVAILSFDGNTYLSRDGGG